jgi:type VI secretion system protein ImpA
MITLNKYLQPVPGDKPCGEDKWFAEWRSDLHQPLEAAWRNGESPDLEMLLQTALDKLELGRDLRVAVVLCLALFQTEGLSGLLSGLELIGGLLERFWDDIYPLPETSDDQIRINALSNLAAPLGNDTPYQFVKFLRETPLCRSTTGTTYSFADLQRAEAGNGQVSNEGLVVTFDQIDAVFRANSKGDLRKNVQLLIEIEAQVDRIENFVRNKMGSSASANLDPLKTILKEMVSACQPYQEKTGQQPNIEAPDRVATTRQGGAGDLLSIRSRADADAALAAVSDYLKRNEPSSPAPYVIERARRLLKMDFMESMQDLAPDAVEKFNTLFGLKEQEKRQEESAGS